MDSLTWTKSRREPRWASPRRVSLVQVQGHRPPTAEFVFDTLGFGTFNDLPVAQARRSLVDFTLWGICKGRSTLSASITGCSDIDHATRVPRRPDCRSSTGGARSLSVVDVPSMRKSHHDHQEHIVLDPVDDAVVTNTNTKSRSTRQSPRTWRARILSEQGDGALDATAGSRIELA